MSVRNAYIVESERAERRLRAFYIRFEPVQDAGHKPHVARDGHAVVIDDQDRVGAETYKVVQSFVCKSSGQRAVADERDDLTVGASARDAAKQRDGRRRMTGVCTVIYALFPLRKAGKSAQTAQRRERLTPAGEELVGIALMTDVKDEFVFGAIEDAVHCDDDLDDAEIGRQMPAVGKHDGDDLFAKFRGEFVQLCSIQFFDVGRRSDAIDDLHCAPLRRVCR